MVRWWAAFFVCGVVFPPTAGDVRAAIAAAAGAFLVAGRLCAARLPARARAYCVAAAAGGLVLWQAAGVARAFHDAAPPRSGGARAVAAAGDAAPRAFDRVSLPAARDALARSLDDGRLPERARALVAALVLDERSGLRPSLREAYGYLGITHFLALSGMHLAAIACALDRLLAPVARGARRREAALLVLLGAYCSVVCFPASLVRSYALIAAVAAFRAAGLSSDLFGSLAAGSFAVAAVDPAAPFDAGFELSFAAVCGIAFVAAPLARMAEARLPKGIVGAAVRAVALPAIVTCAVQIFTLPLTVALFGRSSLVSPLANVVVSLPFTALLYAGLLYVFVPLGVVRGLLATPVALLCRFLDAAPARLARGPQPGIIGGDANWAIYGCGVIAIAHALGPGCRRRTVCAVCGVLLAAASFGGTLARAVRPSEFPRARGERAPREIAGRGYRYLAEGGGVLFVGSRFGEREARALVRAFWRSGVRAVECCVLVPSRLRRGHGWPYLASRVAVRRCLASPYLAPRGGSFRASCERAGIECVVVSAGSLPAAGALVLEVLGPSYPPPPGAAVSSRAARLLCRVAGREGTASREPGGIDPDAGEAAPAGPRRRRRRSPGAAGAPRTTSLDLPRTGG